MSILSYSQVTKSFGPDTVVLDGVSFSIEPGELVLLTGQTGSGKTTLMKLLTREYTLTSGEIFFRDIAVHRLKLGKVHLLRRQLGIVYQDYRLIKDLNVWENIATPLYIAGKKDADVEQRVSDLLNLINLADKAEAFPSQLSGGEAQRVAIARALALGPELIFADEPTGNLDSQTSKGIANLLGKINELGTTIILATHDLTLLDVFSNERHLQILGGKITSDQGKTDSAPSPTPKEEPEVSDEENSLQEKNRDTILEKAPDTSLPADEPMVPKPKSDSDTAQSTTDAEQIKKRSIWHRLQLSRKKSHSSSKKLTKHNQKNETDSAKKDISTKKQEHSKTHKV